jgi:hypothetical protein
LDDCKLTYESHWHHDVSGKEYGEEDQAEFFGEYSFLNGLLTLKYDDYAPVDDFPEDKIRVWCSSEDPNKPLCLQLLGREIFAQECLDLKEE